MQLHACYLLFLCMRVSLTIPLADDERPFAENVVGPPTQFLSEERYVGTAIESPAPNAPTIVFHYVNSDGVSEINLVGAPQPDYGYRKANCC